MIRALFLDAAGTLIEPAEPVAAVYASAARELGIHAEEQSVRSAFAEVFAAMPDPLWAAQPNGDLAERAWWRGVVATVFERAGGELLSGDLLDRCFRNLFDHYADPAAWHVFPEVPDVLAEARAAGLKLAVVSNFDRRLHGILAGHGLEFDAVITSADARARKPDPAIFLAALEALGLRAGEVFHAGDSRGADLAGAAAAGIEARLVERPDRDLRSFLAAALGPRSK